LLLLPGEIADDVHKLTRRLCSSWNCGDRERNNKYCNGLRDAAGAASRLPHAG
jgi:hypothetical protein